MRLVQWNRESTMCFISISKGTNSYRRHESVFVCSGVSLASSDGYESRFTAENLYLFLFITCLFVIFYF